MQERINTGNTNPYNITDTKLIQPIVQPWKTEDIEGAFSTWLQYNQVKLTIPFLSNILVAGNDGIASDQAAVFNTILEKEPIIQAHLQTRKLAVQAVDWDIMGGSEYKRTELKKIITNAGLEKLKTHLLDAIGFGYSGAGINWIGGGGNIENFDLINHVNWMFDRYGNIAFITRLGKQIPLIQDNKSKFVFHTYTMKCGIPSTGGVIRSLIWTYFFKHIGIQQQARFLEKYGMPFLIAKINANDFENEPLRSTIKNQLRNLGSEGAGVVSNNAEVTTVQAASGQGGNGDFARWISYCDSVFALCILGQLASSSDGGGFSKGQIQENVRKDLLVADCKSLEDTINNQIIKPLEYYKYGTNECYMEMDYKEPEDLTAKADLVGKLNSAGYRAERKWVEETFGIPLEKEVEVAKTPDIGSALTAMGNVPPMPSEVAPVTPAPLPSNLSVGAPETPMGAGSEALSVPPPPSIPMSDLKKKSNVLGFADSLDSIKANALGIINSSNLPEDVKAKAIDAVNTSDENSMKSNVSGVVSVASETDTPEITQAKQSVISAINGMDVTISKPVEEQVKPTEEPTTAVATEEKPSTSEKQTNLRADGTPKGNGWFGAIQRPDGGVMSELGIGVEFGEEVPKEYRNKEIQIPLLVPTLTADEIDKLKTHNPGDEIPESILRKAEDFAIDRLKQNKSPFIDEAVEKPVEKPIVEVPEEEKELSEVVQKQDAVRDSVVENIKVKPTEQAFKAFKTSEQYLADFNSLSKEDHDNAVTSYDKREKYMKDLNEKEIQELNQLQAVSSIAGKLEVDKEGKAITPTEQVKKVESEKEAIRNKYDNLRNEYITNNPLTQPEIVYKNFLDGAEEAVKNGLQEVFNDVMGAGIEAAIQNKAGIKTSTKAVKETAFREAWNMLPEVAKHIYSEKTAWQNFDMAVYQAMNKKDYAITSYRSVKDAQNTWDATSIIINNSVDKFLSASETLSSDMAWAVKEWYQTATGNEEGAKKTREDIANLRKYHELTTDQIKASNAFEQMFYGLAEMAPTLIVTMATAPLGGSAVGIVKTIGLAVPMAIGAASSYNELRQNGVSWGGSALGGLSIGVITGFIQQAKALMMMGSGKANAINKVINDTVVSNMKAIERNVGSKLMNQISMYLMNPVSRGTSAFLTAQAENIVQDALTVNMSSMTRIIDDIITGGDTSQFNLGLQEQLERYKKIIEDTTLATGAATFLARGIHKGISSVNSKYGKPLWDEQKLQSEMVTKTNAKTILDDALKTIGIKSDNLTIHPDASGLKEGEKAAVSIKNGKIDVYVDPTRIASARDLINTVIGHEVFAHYFLDTMSPQKKMDLYNEIVAFNDSLPENQKFFTAEDKARYAEKARVEGAELSDLIRNEIVGRYFEQNFNRIKPNSKAGQFLTNAKNWIMTNMLNVVDSIINNVVPREKWKTKSAEWLKLQREKTVNEMLGETFKNFSKDKFKPASETDIRYSAFDETPSVKEMAGEFRAKEISDIVNRLSSIEKNPDFDAIRAKLDEYLKTRNANILNDISNITKNIKVSAKDNVELNNLIERLKYTSDTNIKDNNYISNTYKRIEREISDEYSKPEEDIDYDKINDLKIDLMRLRSIVPIKRLLNLDNVKLKDKVGFKEYLNMRLKQFEKLAEDGGEIFSLDRETFNTILDGYIKEVSNTKDMYNDLTNIIDRNISSFEKEKINKGQPVSISDLVDSVDANIPVKYNKLIAKKLQSNVVKAIKSKGIKEISAEPIEDISARTRQELMDMIASEKTKPTWNNRKIKLLQDKLTENIDLTGRIESLNRRIPYLQDVLNKIQNKTGVYRNYTDDQINNAIATTEANIANANTELIQLKLDAKQYLKTNDPRYGMTLTQYFKNLLNYGDNATINAVKDMANFRKYTEEYINQAFDDVEDLNTARQILDKSINKIMSKYKDSDKAAIEMQNALESIDRAVEIRQMNEAGKFADRLYKRSMMYNNGEELYNDIIRSNNPDAPEWNKLSNDEQDSYNNANKTLDSMNTYNQMLVESEIRLLMAQDALTKGTGNQATVDNAQKQVDNLKKYIGLSKADLLSDEFKDLYEIVKTLKSDDFKDSILANAKDIVKSFKYFSGAEKKLFINQLKSFSNDIAKFKELIDKIEQEGNTREKKAMELLAIKTLDSADTAITKATKQGAKSSMSYQFTMMMAKYLDGYKFTESDSIRLTELENKDAKYLASLLNESYSPIVSKDGGLDFAGRPDTTKEGITSELTPAERAEYDKLSSMSEKTNGQTIDSFKDKKAVIGMLDKMTTDDIKDLINNVRLIKKTGRNAKQIEDILNKLEWEDNKSQMLVDLDSNRAYSSLEEAQNARKISWLNSITGTGWMAIRKEVMINYLTKFKKDSKFFDLTMGRLMDCIYNEQKLREQYNAFSTENYGNTIGRYDVTKKQFDVNYYDENGKLLPIKEKLSLDDLMFVYAQSRNEIGKLKLLNTKFDKNGNNLFSEKSINEMIDILNNHENGKYARMADKQIKFYSDVQYKLVNEVFKREHNVDMPKDENYFPQDMTEFEGIQDMGMMEIARARYTKYVNKNMTLARQSINGFDISRMSYFDTVNRNAQKVIYYATFNDYVKDLNRIFKDKDLQGAIKDRSDSVYNILANNWLPTIATNRIPKTYMDSLLSSVRNVFSIAALGLKVPTILIQLPQVFYGLYDNPMAFSQQFQAIGEFTLDNRQTRDFCYKNSKVIPLRMHSMEHDFVPLAKQIDVGLNEIFNGQSLGWSQVKDLFGNMAEMNAKSKVKLVAGAGKQFFDTMYSGLRHYSFYPLQLADQAMAMLAWKANYNAYTSRGMTHDDAVKECDRIIRTTQPLSDIRLNAEMFNSPMCRVFTLFKSPQNQIFSMMFQENAKAIYQIMERDKSLMARLGNAASTFARYNSMIIMASVFTQLLRSMGSSNPFTNPEETITETLKTVTGGIPIFSNFADIAYNYGDSAWKQSRGEKAPGYLQQFNGTDDMITRAVGQVHDTVFGRDKDRIWTDLGKQLLPASTVMWGMENSDIRNALTTDGQGMDYMRGMASLIFSANQLKLKRDYAMTYATGSNQVVIDKALNGYNKVMSDVIDKKKQWHPERPRKIIEFTGKKGSVNINLTKDLYDTYVSIAVDNFDRNATVIDVKSYLSRVGILTEYEVKKLRKAWSEALQQAKRSIAIHPDFRDKYIQELINIDYR